MTETPGRTPYCHKIRYGITGAPILTEDEMDGTFAPGVGVRPTLIELVYIPVRDGKPARIDASVTGDWMRFGKPDPFDGQTTTHFKSGPDGWPEWLAAEARLHDPDAAALSAGPAPAADRSALVDRTRALTLLEAADFLRDAHHRDGLTVQEIGTALRNTADRADPMAGSLARDGFGLDEIAAMLDKPALRRMADCHECETGAEHAVHCPTPETHNWGCGCPSDVAAAVASCPGRELDGPSPCRCPCYGCKHHCSAHDPSRMADETPQQPEAPDCDVEFVGGGHCSKPAGHRTLANQDPHTPAAVAQPDEEAEGPRTVCVCGHTKGEHVEVSGRLLCDACDPDSTDNLVCKEFEAL